MSVRPKERFSCWDLMSQRKLRCLSVQLTIAIKDLLSSQRRDTYLRLCRSLESTATTKKFYRSNVTNVTPITRQINPKNS